MTTSQKQVIQDLINKTYQELSAPPKPKQRSRIWQSSHGYKFLVQWSNSVLLRILGKKVIESIKSSYSPLSSSNHPLSSSNHPLSSSNIPLKSSNIIGWKLLDRTEAQILDATRSVTANIEEGFSRPTTSEYLQFLGYSQGSLAEVKGDIERLLQDKLIKSVKNSTVLDLGIDLKKWNNWTKDPQNSSRLLYFPLSKNKGDYRKLEEIKGNDITYEMLLELANKTDYLLRKLVESLEKKLSTEQKAYQIERSRIKSKLKINP